MVTGILQKLIIVIVGALFLASVVRIFLRSKNVNPTERTQIFKTAEYFNAWVILLCFIITMTYGIFNHFELKKSVHAVISLNREDNGNRKYILVEQGEYFDTVVKPRIQKAVYSSEWDKGRATNPETGISQCFKILAVTNCAILFLIGPIPCAKIKTFFLYLNAENITQR